MRKSILLIGGSGFLGSALRRTLAHDPQFTVAFSHTGEHAVEEAPLLIDVFRPETLTPLRQFDIVVNLTGQFVQPLSRCFALNTTGMWNILQALGDRATLVQVSTTLVYGTARMATEQSPLNPEFPYAAGKAAAEFLLQTILPRERFLIVRLSNLYGAGQTKGLLWYLVDRIAQGKPVIITDNDGNVCRHFLHVDDAAAILHGLIVRGATGMVNVPGPEVYTIRELVALCEELCERKIPASYATAPPLGNIDNISTEKLASLLPLHWQYSVREYLRAHLPLPVPSP